MLEDRLDMRLQAGGTDGDQGIADRWKSTRREREAAAFESIADQIEAGMLKISGVPEEDVVDRLRTRARDTLEGRDRMRRRRAG